MAKSFDLQRINANLRKAISELPYAVGNHAVNFSLDRFKYSNWIGTTVQPWQKRKAIKGKPNDRALLIRTGRLRRSIRFTVSGLTTRLATDVPYARAHNYGFRGTVNVKAHTRNRFTSKKVGTGKLTKKGVQRMKTVKSISGSIAVKAHTKRMNLPKRQFMGESPVLTQQLKRIVQAALTRAMSS